MNVDESWAYVSGSATLESGQRISSSSTRMLNNTWTVNAAIQTALRNGRPIDFDTIWLTLPDRRIEPQPWR